MTSYGMDTEEGVADTSPISQYGARRGTMIAIACFTATLSAALLYDVLPPIMSNLSGHFGGGAHGTFIAQLAGTLPLFGVMLGGLAAGWIVERIGVRPALLSAMAVFGMAGSAGVLIDDETAFLATRLLMGAGAGVMTAACNAMIAIYFSGAPRARMNGIIIGSGAIGGIVFVLIAGLIAAWWWRGPFLLHGVIVLVFLLPVLAADRVPMSAPITRHPLANLRRLRPILPPCLTGFAWFVTMLLSGVKTPFVMAQSGITDHGTIGIIYALNAASVSLSSFLFGHFVPRYRPVPVIRLAFLLAAVGLCIVATAHSVPHFVLGLVVNGTSAGIALTAIWTWGMRLTPRDLVARALGTMTTCLYLGGAMMPVLTAPYERTLGVRGQFLGMAATIVVVVALLWIAQRDRAAPVQAAGR